MTLTHRERLFTLINEPSSVDRPPVALWRHFPVDDQASGTLAEATVAYQNLFDFDLVKVTPASSFCLKDWGAEDSWEGHPEGTRRFKKNVIENPGDWEKLNILDPRRSFFLSEQISCLSQIRKSLSYNVPILQTIFSPLAQAKNLVGKKNLLMHIQKYPEAVNHGLGVIAETTRRFIEQITEIGIDGIFYAIQHAQRSELSLEEYYKFGNVHDINTLVPANALWCNILHLHGANIYFELTKSFASTFHIINWHDRETQPSLAEGLNQFPGSVCGGVGQNSIVFSDQKQIESEVENAFSQTSRKRFILGTGCVVPIIAPYGNILAIRKSVEGVS
jgi:uroporphyrinogen decarboxylase